MGRTVQTIKLTNEVDRVDALRHRLAPSAIRTVEAEALVDTGAISVAIPPDVAERLGLAVVGYEHVRYANGSIERIDRVGPVRIEILGRDMLLDVLVIPGARHVIIGQVAMEMMDLIVDPRSRELRVNPENPDAPVLDV